MAFHTKTGNVNLKSTEQMAHGDQLNVKQMPIALIEFDEDDDMFSTNNENDADVTRSMMHVGDSGSDSDSSTYGGWDTQKFLQTNIASSDGDINLSSRRYGRTSSNSDRDEPHRGKYFLSDFSKSVVD